MYIQDCSACIGSAVEFYLERRRGNIAKMDIASGMVSPLVSCCCATLMEQGITHLVPVRT